MSKAKSLRALLLIALAILLAGKAVETPAQAQDETPMERPLLLAHYMPWYQSLFVSGYWGWHWTMNHFNPSLQTEDGKPEIASQYMPLTGPYDSQDDALLEYQVLLMKLSGIDGVIVDWYGTDDFRDYAVINAATSKLFEYTKKAGLLFSICYEDQTIKHMIDDNFISGEDARSHGQDTLRYVQDNWFSDDSYVRYNGQPLLFVFGPQYFRSADDWTSMFSGLPETPGLVTLDNNLSFGSLANYPWPPMSMAGGMELLPAVLESYLDLFYRNARRKDVVIGSAFPSFHDIYEEAGVRSSYGYVDPRDGDTLRLTFDKALENNASIIQLVTWNDYGEGTMIEPTEETGYQSLEIVQQYRTELDTEGFANTPDNLRLPLQLFNLRKAYAKDADVQARLDDAFNAIIAGDLTTAEGIIGSIPKP